MRRYQSLRMMPPILCQNYTLLQFTSTRHLLLGTRSVYCTITTKCSRYVTRYTYCSLGNMFTTWSYTLLNRKMFTSIRSSLAGQSDRWPTLLLGLCASEFRRNRRGPPRYLLMRLPSRGAPTPLLYPRCQLIRFESSCVSRFQPEVEPEDYLCFLRDIAFKLYVVWLDDSSRGRTEIYDRRILKPSKISIKPTQPFSMSSRQIPPSLHSSSRLKVNCETEFADAIEDASNIPLQQSHRLQLLTLRIGTRLTMILAMLGGGIVRIIVYQSCTLIWSKKLGLQEVLDVISWGVHPGMLRVTYVNIVQFTPRRYTLHERSVVIVQ